VQINSGEKPDWDNSAECSQSSRLANLSDIEAHGKTPKLCLAVGFTAM